MRPYCPRTRSIQRPKRVGHAGAWRVDGSQIAHQRRSEFGRRQDALELVKRRDDRVVEPDGGDRARFQHQLGWERHGARRQRLVEDGARPDFVPVVILSLDPEDRHDRHLVLARDLLGELDRAQRLEQRVERPSEEAGLLAGDDGDRARIGERAPGVDGARRRVATLLLGVDDRRDLLSPWAAGLRGRNGARPGGAVGGIAGKKGRDRFEVVARSRRRGGRIPGKRRMSTAIRVDESDRFAGTREVLSQRTMQGASDATCSTPGVVHRRAPFAPSASARRSASRTPATEGLPSVPSRRRHLRHRRSSIRPTRRPMSRRSIRRMPRHFRRNCRRWRARAAPTGRRWPERGSRPACSRCR